MGNSHNRNYHYKHHKPTNSISEQTHSSQFSLSQFVGNLSGRSFLSVTSNPSVYSASRPWSRVSRRRWNESTLKNPLEASKTAWPVANKESIFLPEFPIKTDLNQKDFEIVNTIAKGAFGDVYKVKKVSTQEQYALKVLRKCQVISESAVQQVKDECRIQQACGHHCFIVGAVSRWQTKKRLYIVSEYIPGGELLALIERYNKLPEDLVKLFVAEIAIAIDFLHNAGVIYRDLKPENILLDPECHIQLIDFGLSKWLSIGARTTTLCGTLKYMAPEIISREPYGHAVDWWSLGVMACRMLTAEYPTPAVTRKPKTLVYKNDPEGMNINNDVTSSIKQNTFDEVAPFAGSLPASANSLSRGAHALLIRLLEKDPRRRLRNLRLLEQSAFYMGYNFEDVRKKKISARSIIEEHFPDGPPPCPREHLDETDGFFNFDQATIV